MTPRRLLLFAAGTALAAGIAAGTLLGQFGRIGSQRQPAVAGLLWPPRAPLPDFLLTDQDAHGYSRARLLGRWSLVFFGFTNCPDICPNTLAALAQVRRELARQEQAFDVVFVSVDPDRDAPAKLAAYVEHFDPDFVGATGETAELDRLTRALGVIYAKTELPGGHYTVDHSAAVLIIDPQARLIGILSAPHVPAEMVTRARAIREYVEAHS